MYPKLTNTLENLTIGKASEEEDEAIVKQILECNQDVFSEGENDVGFCDKVKHTINVSDEIAQLGDGPLVLKNMGRSKWC